MNQPRRAVHDRLPSWSSIHCTKRPPIQELEARQAQAALQLNAAQLLEAQTVKALDAFKRESAAALAKHAQAEAAEAARMRDLANKFEEAKHQVRRLGVGESH